MTYTKEALAGLAKGVFADDKTSPSIYADAEGTFRNSTQYDALEEKDQKKFPFEFKNLNRKEEPTAPEGGEVEPTVKAAVKAAKPKVVKKLVKPVKAAKPVVDEVTETETKTE